MDPKLFVLTEIYYQSGLSPERHTYYIDQYLFPEDVSGKYLLDVGGADGSVALWLRLNRKARVDVLDEYEGHGSPTANKDRLNDRLKRFSLQDMRVITSDFRKAAIPDQTYDAIYTRNCLHHVFGRDKSDDKDLIEAMRLFSSWLKPEGRLLIGEIG